MSRISASAAAVTGMLAAQRRLEVSAGNVANVSTPGFVPSRVISSEQREGGVQTRVERGMSEDAGRAGGSADSATDAALDELAVSGTDLGTEFVSQITSQRAFEANLAVIRTEAEMLGSLVRRNG
jgi:flagellar hook protein FlgE